MQKDADALLRKLQVILQEIIGVYTRELGVQHVDVSALSVEKMEEVKENLANQYLARKLDNNGQSQNSGDLDL